MKPIAQNHCARRSENRATLSVLQLFQSFIQVKADFAKLQLDNKQKETFLNGGFFFVLLKFRQVL